VLVLVSRSHENGRESGVSGTRVAEPGALAPPPPQFLTFACRRFAWIIGSFAASHTSPPIIFLFRHHCSGILHWCWCCTVSNSVEEKEVIEVTLKLLSCCTNPIMWQLLVPESREITSSCDSLAPQLLCLFDLQLNLQHCMACSDSK